MSRKASVTAVLTLALVGACSDSSIPSATRVLASPDIQAMVARGEIPPGYMATPAGLYHVSCVHEIPDHATLTQERVVRLRTGQAYSLPPCAYPAFPSLPGRANQAFEGLSKQATNPTVSGYVQYTRTQNVTLPFRRVVADWTVPPAPAGGPQFPNGKVYYSFPGFVNATFILQPVLQYGVANYQPFPGWPTQNFGGHYWQLASWQCGSGATCAHSAAVQVNPGDAIHGDVAATNCANNSCSWYVTTQDVTTGGATVLNVQDDDQYLEGIGGAVEVYNYSQCTDFPVNANPDLSGVFFTNIALTNTQGSYAPFWYNDGHMFDSPRITPWCNYRITSSPSTITSLYAVPPFGAYLNGPTNIARFQSAQYIATQSYGYPGYTYRWHNRTGFNSTSYGAWSPWTSSGSTNYTYFSVNTCGIGAAQVEVEVTDSHNSVATSNISINITNPC
jgi:hypothetical protein